MNTCTYYDSCLIADRRGIFPPLGRAGAQNPPQVQCDCVAFCKQLFPSLPVPPAKKEPLSLCSGAGCKYPTDAAQLRSQTRTCALLEQTCLVKSMHN